MRKQLLRFYLFCKNFRNGDNRHPRRILLELQDSQYWTKKKMQDHQLNKINELITQSSSKIPYYYKITDGFEEGYPTLKDFKNHFPKITKEIIAEESSNLENPDIENFAIHSTSGSTGMPLKLKVSNLAESYRIANRLRFYNWWDLDFYDKHVLIWRAPKKTSSFAKNCIKTLQNYLMGRMNIDVFDLSQKNITKHVSAIERFQPKYIRGYKSGILEFARLMSDKNLKFKSSSVKLIIVTSEVLFSEERQFMEDVFGVKVANEYGAADGGQFAFDCPEKSLHINEESVFITTDENNNLCLTEFYNDKMPLINYENQDRVVFSDKQCPCGRTLKIIDHVIGRTSEFILCSDGSKKHSLIFSSVFNELENRFPKSIKQFKVIQDCNLLIFELVQGIDYSKEIEGFIRKNVNEKICNNMDVSFIYVNRIDREPNGKLRYFIKKDS